MWRQLGQGVRTGTGAKCVSACAVWLLSPVRERMGGECLCPSTGTPWAASRTASTVTWWLLPDVLVRVGSSRHSRRSLWRGCGCIRSSLAAVSTCSISRSVRRLPVGGLHRPCDHEALLTTLPTRRFSWRTTGSALASPSCRASASAANQSAALSSSVSSVCHTVSCSATSLLSIERITTAAGRNSPKRRAA